MSETFREDLRAARAAAEERRQRYTITPWDLIRHAPLTKECCEFLATGTFTKPPEGGGSFDVDGETVGFYRVTTKGVGYHPGWAADLKDCDPRLTWNQTATLLRQRLPADLVASMPAVWAEHCRLVSVYGEAFTESTRMWQRGLGTDEERAQARATEDAAHAELRHHWITQIRAPLKAAMDAAVTAEQTSIFDHLEETR